MQVEAKGRGTEVFSLEMKIRSTDQRQTNFIEVLYAILTNFVLHFSTNSLEPTDRPTKTLLSPISSGMLLSPAFAVA